MWCVHLRTNIAIIMKRILQVVCYGILVHMFGGLLLHIIQLKNRRYMYVSQQEPSWDSWEDATKLNKKHLEHTIEHNINSYDSLEHRKEHEEVKHIREYTANKKSNENVNNLTKVNNRQYDANQEHNDNDNISQGNQVILNRSIFKERKDEKQANNSTKLDQVRYFT